MHGRGQGVGHGIADHPGDAGGTVDHRPLPCLLTYVHAFTPGESPETAPACARGTRTSRDGKSSSMASLIRFTAQTSIPGRSGASASFSLGMITRRTPACAAPCTFSYTPPTGLTLPWMEISPVTATSCRTGRFHTALM